MEHKSGSSGGQRRGISGSTLKLIAIITMFIDHIGAIVVERMIRMSSPVLEGMGVQPDPEALYQFYITLRYIGRLGFPLFCFLLIEGFCHTRNKKKYAERLFLFALISELPFDLGFTGGIFYPQYQNVFFTLFLGFLVMTGIEWIEEKKTWEPAGRLLFEFVVVSAGIGCAEFLQTDYGGMGVFTIVFMYALRQWRLLSAAAGCTVLTCMNALEVSAYTILLPVWLYDGRRGWKIKWLFYLFYPVHILLLYGIACGLGLGEVMLR